MTAEAIREHLQAAPFLPFTIHLTNGRDFFVDHPDFVTILRDNRHMLINFEGVRVATVDLDHIAYVQKAAAEREA